MKPTILILGKGNVGTRLHNALGWPVCTQRIATFDDVNAIIAKYKPDIIVNCIGHNGEKNVDDCEKVPDKTVSANTFVPILLAEGAIRHNIKLVHISSGCIYHYDYEKQKPITEDRTPDYFNLYFSRTKIYTESILEPLSRRHNILIARIRVPLDDRTNPKNILTKLLGFKTIIDIPNSVTYIPDFIKALQHLIKIDARGLYNIALKGALRYPELLKAYQKQKPGLSFDVIPMNKLNLARTNLILSTTKLQKSGFNVRTPKEILSECVKNYLKQS